MSDPDPGFDFDAMDPDWDDVPPELAQHHRKSYMIDGIPTMIWVPAHLFAEARRRQEDDD